MSTTIVLADDHGIVRDGVRLLLCSKARYEVVAVAANGVDAVRLTEQHQPDLAIFDISMPGMSGIIAAEQAAICSPHTKVIILSMYGDSTHVINALQAGARGFVLKEAVGAELLCAVDTVVAGERYLSHKLMDMLVDGFINQPTTTYRVIQMSNVLNSREREVLRFVAEGRSSASIGESLGLATSTVDTYRSRIMQKLGINSSVGLARFAVQAGLIQA